MVLRRNVVGLRGELKAHLERMEKNDPDILGSIVMRGDGLILASAIRFDVDSDLLAAMLSSIFSISSRVSGELRVGSLENIVIKSSESIIAISQVVEGVVLGVIARSGANLGLLLYEVSKCRDNLAKSLSKL